MRHTDLVLGAHIAGGQELLDAARAIDDHRDYGMWRLRLAIWARGTSAALASRDDAQLSEAFLRTALDRPRQGRTVEDLPLDLEALRHAIRILARVREARRGE